ncbi:GNAT family N-acetyltransferase [Halostella sp. JP-L12]|uniref:GNAT family N-acetyltransferase n=1 Tax=Halostella TaxID=1843185 RepID=UPI000EF8318F|nr:MULTISPECIES: GNAT family N-acetyltransferase [Halostella]NHN48281.1 GNAT family N-acetyltransferase [Halostella sp. JP-L12]
MTVEVRRATLDDVDGIRRVAEAGWEAAYGDILAPETRAQCLARWYSPEAVERAVTEPSVGHFVAAADGVVGYASGDVPRTESVGRLSSIYVHPDRWGDGIGTRLLDAVEAYLADRGASEIQILVLADNSVGVEFYRARGFERVETRPTTLAGETLEEYVFRGEV